MKIPKYVLKILTVIQNNGYTAYLVGGCVRDHYLGKQPKDYDIATSATPDRVQSLFQKTVPTGIKHGTITVIETDGVCEVTTYRVDGKYEDNRRPESVQYVKTIEDDLSRRDFTINAIAYDGTKSVDPFYGRLDIQNKCIRAVGNPDDRFKEDALRMLRAVRFAAQLHFTIEIQTKLSIKDNANLLRNISTERIRDELCKILLSDNPSYGFRLLVDLDLLSVVIPELVLCEHIVSVVKHSPKDIVVRLAALFHELEGSIIIQNILKRLKFDNKIIAQVTTLVKEHGSRYLNLRPIQVKKFINRVGVENLEKLFELQIADTKAHEPPHDFEDVFYMREAVRKVLFEKQPLTTKDLHINGHDLIQLGIKQGKEIGKILNELLELVLEDESMNERDILLRLVREKIDK